MFTSNVHLELSEGAERCRPHPIPELSECGSEHAEQPLARRRVCGDREEPICEKEKRRGWTPRELEFF
jgi:hypothetical protein